MLRSYLLTFSGMTLLYMLRAGYSYSKPYIKQQYQFSLLFLSLVDACQFIGLGLAFLLKYLLFDQTYSIIQFRTNGIVMVAAYFLIPLLPLLGSFSTHFDAFLLICSFLFGFLQFSFQPTLSTEMKRHYNKQNNETMLECWDSGKYVGRMLGFIFMQVAVINFLFSWEASMIILMAATLAIVLLIYYYCDYALEQRPQKQKPSAADITTREFLSYARHLMRMPTTRYYILLTCFYKSLAHNFIYWISTFLFGFNYPQLSGKVSLAFIIPIFVGNFLVGKMHDDAIAD